MSRILYIDPAAHSGRKHRIHDITTSESGIITNIIVQKFQGDPEEIARHLQNCFGGQEINQIIIDGDRGELEKAITHFLKYLGFKGTITSCWCGETKRRF